MQDVLYEIVGWGEVFRLFAYLILTLEPSMDDFFMYLLLLTTDNLFISVVFVFLRSR